MGRKKSILLIGNYPPPFGGVPRHLEYLVPHLAACGWDVHVLSSGTGGVTRSGGATIYKFGKFKRAMGLLTGIFLVKSWESSPGIMSRVIQGRRIIERNDVSLISAYNVVTGAPVGAILQKEYGIPLIVSNFGELYGMTDGNSRNREMVDRICQSASKLLCCSRHCAGSYRRLGLSPDVEVVPYGVDLAEFRPNWDGGVIRREHAIGVDDPAAIYVGRLTREMGLPTMLEAIPRVLERRSDARFFLIGARGELEGESHALARRFPGHVIVRPDLPLDLLPDYYAAATVAVVPTEGERACSSLAAMEAMGAAKPVIGARVGGVPEVVAEGETGLLVPPLDPFALAEGLLELFSDKNRMERMGRAGRARAERLFDKNLTNRRMEEIFTRIAGV